MTLQTHPFVGPIFETSGFPAPGVRIDLAAAVALDADVPLGVAGLAGLQVPPRLCGMFSKYRSILLTIGPQHQMGLDPQRTHREAAVAIAAVLLVVATNAVLRIVQCFYRMDIDKVAPMALGNVIPPEGSLGRVRAVAAALMAIKAVRKLMALAAVIARLSGK